LYIDNRRITEYIGVMKTPTPLRIRTSKAAKHFGNKNKLAQALGVSRQTIQQWGYWLPELRAYQLKEMHPEHFDPAKKERHE
jgi:hypothetical protein